MQALMDLLSNMQGQGQKQPGYSGLAALFQGGGDTGGDWQKNLSGWSGTPQGMMLIPQIDSIMEQFRNQAREEQARQAAVNPNVQDPYADIRDEDKMRELGLTPRRGAASSFNQIDPSILSSKISPFLSTLKNSGVFQGLFDQGQGQ